MLPPLAGLLFNVGGSKEGKKLSVINLFIVYQLIRSCDSILRWSVGSRLRISVACLTARYQNVDGSKLEVSQFHAIWTMVWQDCSTNPFWCCCFEGTAWTLICSSSSRSCETFTKNSFGSESVRMSFGLVLTLRRKSLMAQRRLIVRFLMGISSGV